VEKPTVSSKLTANEHPHNPIAAMLNPELNHDSKTDKDLDKSSLAHAEVNRNSFKAARKSAVPPRKFNGLPNLPTWFSTGMTGRPNRSFAIRSSRDEQNVSRQLARAGNGEYGPVSILQ
jgi:hypothetical protein